MMWIFRKTSLNTTLSLLYICGIVSLTTIGFKCPSRRAELPVPTGGGDHPPELRAGVLKVGSSTKTGCSVPFIITSASTSDLKNLVDGELITIPDACIIRITSAYVEYTYYCGLPTYSELITPWSDKTSYSFKFPYECTDLGTLNPTGEYPNTDYYTEDESVIRENSCRGEGLSWMTSVNEYAADHMSEDHHWSKCSFDTDDKIPYVINPFSYYKGAAGSILYNRTWTYVISKREKENRFLYYRTDVDPPLPVYESNCDNLAATKGICSSDCDDIGQPNLYVIFEYYDDFEDHF